MSGLSHGDYLRRKLEETKCCNPPVYKVQTRDSSEVTEIRRLRAIGQSSVPRPIGRDSSYTIAKNMGCSVRASLGCNSSAGTATEDNIPVPFSPDLFDNLAAWFDAEDETTITMSTTFVTRWADKSTNQNDFVQSDTTLSPTTTTISGSKNALYMSTFNKVMVTESAITTSVTGSNPRSMFLVSIVPGVTSFVSLGYGPHTVALPRNTFGLNFARGATTVYSPYTYGTDITVGSSLSTINLMEGFYDGSNIYGYFNGTLISSQAIALNTSQTVLFLGNRPDLLGNVDATICEIIMYSEELSESRRQQIEGYLAWKWGFDGSLPTGHPFKSAPPSTNE